MLTLHETVDGWTNAVELSAECYECSEKATHYAPGAYGEADQEPSDENVLCAYDAAQWEAAGRCGSCSAFRHRS